MKLLISILFVTALLSYSITGMADSSTSTHEHDESGHESISNTHDDHSDHENENKGHDDHGNDEHGNGEHEEGGVSLTDEKRRFADIEITPLKRQTITQKIIIPGEVKPNHYATSILSPRIDAQIIKRHVQLGQHVKKGHALVTLSSVEMAGAQGNLIITSLEWSRAKKLGRKVISEKRYIEAQISQQQARAKTLAYGMTAKQIDLLLKKGDVASATGQFELQATQSGTVIKDDFIVGEIVEPGRVLFEITDESRLWVEARARPEDANLISNNAKATIKFQNTSFAGKVIQVQHVIDEETRTLPVRIEVNDRNHRLHPGQFVEASLQLTSPSAVIAIPKAAALRNAKGEWVVFVEDKPGRFNSVDITPIRTTGNQLIVEGLSTGMRVVTKGAFFIQSELAKSGFDVHNH